MSIGLTTQWNRSTYVYTPPHTRREILFASLYHTYRSRGLFLFAPYQGSELLRAASSFKRRRKSRTLRSAVPSAAFVFVVFAVVGPSDLGVCLTGALYYTGYAVRTATPCTCPRSCPRNDVCSRRTGTNTTRWRRVTGFVINSSSQLTKAVARAKITGVFRVERVRFAPRESAYRHPEVD